MTDPVIYKNQDTEFRTWVREHPRGRVVNVPNLMIHTPQCDHLGDLMTKAAKACADGPNAHNDLQRWARATKSKKLLICESCGGEEF